MDKLIVKIEQQDYEEHEKLPSEREFCEIYGLSRITVRQALQELTLEGYIYKLPWQRNVCSTQNLQSKLSEAV